MEKLIEILEEIQPDADYENCTTLIDDEILSSMDVMSIVAELEDEYDIRILPWRSCRPTSIRRKRSGRWCRGFRTHKRNDSTVCPIRL